MRNLATPLLQQYVDLDAFPLEITALTSYVWGGGEVITCRRQVGMLVAPSSYFGTIVFLSPLFPTVLTILMNALLTSAPLGSLDRNCASSAGIVIPSLGIAALTSSAEGSEFRSEPPPAAGAGLAAREPFGVACGGEVGRLFAILGLGRRASVPEASASEVAAAGDMGRPFASCFFLRRLWVDSEPLASERLGEPGRLRLALEVALRSGSARFSARPDGVFVPREDAPE